MICGVVLVKSVEIVFTLKQFCFSFLDETAVSSSLLICRREAKCHNNGCNEKSIPEDYKQHLVEKVLMEKMLMEYPSI